MHIFTVRDLTQAVRDILEGEFPFVWVRGQITNLSTPPSGHVYFSLRDEEALLNVVWFKGARPRTGAGEGERVNPLTGEVETGAPLKLADGLEVLVAGRMNVYPPRGTYQLAAELVQEQGQGELAVAFEAMKAKLAARGYFDADRKLAMPRNPRRVAVVTAPQGAALQDFLRVAGDRGCGCTVRVYPSLVQGEAAPARIAAALDLADSDGWAEVIALIRGGGSLEDLWAFNTETVADAVFRARVPVLTGVGHEVDTTIADFVADLRAATPSHAAQLLWTERSVLRQRADEAFLALERGMRRFLSARETALESGRERLFRYSPVRRVERGAFELERLEMRLRQAFRDMTEQRAGALSGQEERLRRAFGPAGVLALQAEVERSRAALEQAVSALLRTRETAALSLEGRLAALDPLAPLERGYALVRDGRGRLVRSRADVATGDGIRIRVADGEFGAQVTETGG